MLLYKYRGYTGTLMILPAFKKDSALFYHCMGAHIACRSKFYKAELLPILEAHGVHPRVKDITRRKVQHVNN